MSKTVLILGCSGKIGKHATESFEERGWSVRRFRRGIDDLQDAARGVDVIVNGFNPPAYHDWARLIPEITQQVTAAARASGATVIIPGNVYNFGAQGGTWSEQTPQEPCSRKGQIRKQMELSYRESGVRTIVLRAGNFIDPQAADDVMSALLLRRLGEGKVMFPGDSTVEQAYCYVPDWARAAAELADKAPELGTFEDIPFPGHTFSAEHLRDWLAEYLERPIQLVGFPWWFFRMASPFWELAREMMEMRYLWSTSHRLSPDKFNKLLPRFRPTPLDEVLVSAVAATGKPGVAARTGRVAVGQR